MKKFKIRETFAVENPHPITEDPLKFSERAMAPEELPRTEVIYTRLRALNSDSLTRNFTYYTRKAIIGSSEGTVPTGFTSFVQPFGTPLLVEHRQQDPFWGGPDASIPTGRIVYAGYTRRKPKEGNMDTDEGIPGTIEGSGFLDIIAAVTDPEAIQRVLGGQFHTVSVGIEALSVIESISGQDLVELMEKGDDFPPYDRGQWYEIDNVSRLSYWTMAKFVGDEISWVNMPSDTRAFVLDKDIGLESLQLMIGEKTKEGPKFFDLNSKEEVDLGDDVFYAIDKSFDFSGKFRESGAVWYKSWRKSRSGLSANESVDIAEKLGKKLDELEGLKNMFFEKIEDKLENLSEDVIIQEMVALGEKGDWSITHYAKAEDLLTEWEAEIKSLEDILKQTIKNHNG